MILDTGRIWFRADSTTNARSPRDRRRSRRWSADQALEPLETRNLLSMISGPQVLEGDSSVRYAVFNITLARAPGRTLTYSYVTGGGIATPSVPTPTTTTPDYVFRQGTVTFGPHDTTMPVEVQIIGDRLVEHNENFYLVVRGNGQIAYGEAIIIDDDPNLGPHLHVSNTAVQEGNNPTVIVPPSPTEMTPPAPTTPTLPDDTIPILSPLTLRRLRKPAVSPLAVRWAARLRPSLQ